MIGPTRQYYQQLLCDFDCAPAGATLTLGSLASYYGATVVEAAKQRLEERWNIETLTDACSTSAENNSSTILVIDAGEEHWLMTGDAGAPALNLGLDALQAVQYDFAKLRFFQVPHHGSHHSVGPTLLNRMLGPKLAAGSAMTRTAYVSSAKSAPKHPSKKVMNAYRRRGVEVHATEGIGKTHGRDNGTRPGSSASIPLPFYSEVED